ncbi:MAG: hypothetical protein ACLSH5_01280 [Christensenellales bacterium]
MKTEKAGELITDTRCIRDAGEQRGGWWCRGDTRILDADRGAAPCRRVQGWKVLMQKRDMFVGTDTWDARF